MRHVHLREDDPEQGHREQEDESSDLNEGDTPPLPLEPIEHRLSPPILLLPTFPNIPEQDLSS